MMLVDASISFLIVVVDSSGAFVLITQWVFRVKFVGIMNLANARFLLD